ncbi:phosphoribosyltransferase family protein [Kribbella sp. NBC_01484]|uniref:orotate phosphoribosyltransferase n=1 Tax=Kribbella sp. NBC_01484 TaxID=2903579 RepID=UPI002E322FD2|nr:phosphoribosyltransferase family protein [Kribbella sp. NBC_01484]
MYTNQITLANPRRTRLADRADVARLTAVPSPRTDLVTRLATVPGLVRPGIAHWDMKTRLPLQPLSNENAYGDPRLLHDLAEPGATFAHQLDVDVIVGAETGGIPLATAVALAGDLPFAFVRKPGYVGHEDHEPRVRGASVTGRRVLLVDDAVSSGTALEAFADELQSEGAILAGVFTLVDMRDVATSVAPIAKTLPIESIATYLDVLTAATDHGILDPATHRLAVDALVNHWPDKDPRWTLLPQAA